MAGNLRHKPANPRGVATREWIEPGLCLKFPDALQRRQRIASVSVWVEVEVGELQCLAIGQWFNQANCVRSPVEIEPKSLCTTCTFFHNPSRENSRELAEKTQDAEVKQQSLQRRLTSLAQLAPLQPSGIDPGTSRVLSELHTTRPPFRLTEVKRKGGFMVFELFFLNELLRSRSRARELQ